VADDSDILIELCKEQWAQARHTETQRATISNLVILVASGIVAFISQQGLGLRMLPLTLVLIALGLFGSLVTVKLYELFHYHHDKAKAWQKRLDELHPTASANNLERAAENEHLRRYPLRRKLRLYALWIVLHVVIAGVGLILTAIVLAQVWLN